MWCLRGYYFKMAPGTVKKAIMIILSRPHFFALTTSPETHWPHGIMRPKD